MTISEILCLCPVFSARRKFNINWTTCNTLLETKLIKNINHTFNWKWENHCSFLWYKNSTNRATVIYSICWCQQVSLLWITASFWCLQYTVTVWIHWWIFITNKYVKSATLFKLHVLIWWETRKCFFNSTDTQFTVYAPVLADVSWINEPFLRKWVLFATLWKVTRIITCFTAYLFNF